MNPTLTVVVPLHNVQSTLHETVEHLLEILPELTPQFELLLVDDGSTDATREAAHEASLSFPQVQLLVQPQRLGPQEALRSALRYAHGEWLLLCLAKPDFDLHEIRKLWDQRVEDGAVFAQPISTRGALGSIPPLPAKLPKDRLAQGESLTPDVLLTPRRLLVAWYQNGDRHGVLVYFRSRGYTVRNIEVRARRQRASWDRLVSTLQDGATARPSATTARRSEQGAATGLPNKRPHLLIGKLKALAWGE